MKDKKIFLKSPLKWAGGKSKLMKIEAISEEEAFRYIQKQAMDRRKTIREIADEILDEI